MGKPQRLISRELEHPTNSNGLPCLSTTKLAKMECTSNQSKSVETNPQTVCLHQGFLMTFLRAIVVSVVFCISANRANAHEGHGAPGAGTSMAHFLLSPYHLLPLVLFTIALMAIRRFTKSPGTGCFTKLHDAPPS
jgi:hypothetical protein